MVLLFFSEYGLMHGGCISRDFSKLRKEDMLKHLPIRETTNCFFHLFLLDKQSWDLILHYEQPFHLVSWLLS